MKTRTFCCGAMLPLATCDLPGHTGRGIRAVFSRLQPVVTPNSGSGASQTFTFVWSDGNGYADMNNLAVIFDTSITSVGACYFGVDPVGRSIWFTGDNGAYIGSVAIGSSGTVQNSQCIVNASGSTLSGSGNNLTLTVTLTFKPAFAGAKSIYLYAQNYAGLNSWQTKGSWTVPGSPSPDFSLTMSPNPATVTAGGSVSYTVTVTGANGFGGTVNFTPSGLPSGATASFSPASVTGSGSTTLTIATSMSGATGSFTITASGASASLSHGGAASLSANPNDCSTPFWGDNRIVMVTPNDVYAYTDTWSIDPGAIHWTNYATGTLKRGTTTINGPQDASPTTGTTHASVQFPDFDPTLPSGTYVMTGEHWKLGADCQSVPNYGQHFFTTFKLSVPEVRSISPSPSYGFRGSVATIDVYGVGMAGVDGAQVSGSGVTFNSKIAFGDTNVRISFNIAANAQSSTTPRAVTLTASNPNAVIDNSDPNNPKRTNINTPVTANPFDFTIADPTPVINGVQQLGPLTPGDSAGAYISIYGNNFGSSPGTLGFCVQGAPDPCTGAGIDYAITYWSNIQVNALLTAQPAALVGTYDVQLTAATGATGFNFQPAPQGGTKPNTRGRPVNVTPLSSVSQVAKYNGTIVDPLNLSTGDTSGRQITTSVNPNSATFNVVYNTLLLSNPNSSCAASLTIPSGNAVGFIDSPVSAGPAGCSGIFQVSANANGKNSLNSNAVVVPPQILIQMMSGEASTQPRAQGDTVSQRAIGVATRNRFSRPDLFSGVTTYQQAITSDQFNGIDGSLTNGPDYELSAAAEVFSGTTSIDVAGAACFFSPTAVGWDAIQTAFQNQAADVPKVTFDPKCYGLTTFGRQIVIKQSIGMNANGSGAIAFVFERERPSASDPAVIQIP